MLRLSGQPTMRASDATAAILKFRKGEIIYAQGDAGDLAYGEKE